MAEGCTLVGCQAMALTQLFQTLKLFLHRCVRHAGQHDLQLQALVNGALPVAAFGGEGGAQQLGSTALEIRDGPIEH